MFIFSNKCGCASNTFLTRTVFCSSSCLRENHYMTLGLTPAATQEDIKKAYFELCKIHHPDKNDGSSESTKKFRIITEAYEILGNEKLRMKYDQKMCYNTAVGSDKYTNSKHEDYNYEAERYFYKRRIIRRFSGRTWYFNFDEWTRAHYPQMTEAEIRKMKQKRHWREEKVDKERQLRSERSNLIVLSVILLLVMVTSIFGVMPMAMNQNYGAKERVFKTNEKGFPLNKNDLKRDKG